MTTSAESPVSLDSVRQPDLLKIRDSAAYLNCCETLLRKLVGSGELPVVRFGRAVRIQRADLDALIERSRSSREA